MPRTDSHPPAYDAPGESTDRDNLCGPRDVEDGVTSERTAVGATPNERDESFTRFVVANSDALLRTAWLLTGSIDDARDLVQVRTTGVAVAAALIVVTGWALTGERFSRGSFVEITGPAGPVTVETMPREVFVADGRFGVRLVDGSISTQVVTPESSMVTVVQYAPRRGRRRRTRSSSCCRWGRLPTRDRWSSHSCRTPFRWRRRASSRWTVASSCRSSLQPAHRVDRRSSRSRMPSPDIPCVIVLPGRCPSTRWARGRGPTTCPGRGRAGGGRHTGS